MYWGLEPQQSGTLKQLPQRSKQTNLIWLRDGVGQIGSTRNQSSRQRRTVKPACRWEGNSMLNLVDNSIQQATGNTAASQVYSENVSIWHHMSEALHQSLYRVLTLLIAVLPGILAFFVALVVFATAGVVISWVLRRCLSWVKFDARIAQKSGTDWAPASSPTEIVARASFWICVLL